jgi:hypothetical protein
MKLQKGDKVRFLNEAIEGEVTELLTKGRVEVITSDGFTQVVPESLLVKVIFEITESNEPADVIRHPTPIEDVVTPDRSVKKQQSEDLISFMEVDETLYAALTLVDELSPLTTDVELTVLNNSSENVLLLLSKRIDDSLELVLADQLHARSQKVAGKYTQDELHAFNGFLFQMLLFKKGTYQRRPAFEKVLQVDSSQFIDHTYWEKMSGMANRVLLMPLMQLKSEQPVDIEHLVKKYTPSKEVLLQKKAIEKKVASKYVVLTKEKVVDLHIEELLKDFEGMTNAQIIAYQINHFLREMDQAIFNKLHKITFIHGVGQGVLKSAIREELKKFEKIEFGDGPSEKYGYGATEVVFR